MNNAFGIRPEERTSLYIDGPNLYAATKAMGFDIDYKKLHAHFANTCSLVRINYFTALADDQGGEVFQTIRPLIDWLDYNNYNVVTKTAKVFDDAAGRRKVKGNMDINIAVDMMESASFLDHVVLFSGDGDFLPLIEAMKRRGVRTTVVSVLEPEDGSPQMIADDLRRAADTYVDLRKIKSVIAKEPRERQDRGDRDTGTPHRAAPASSGVNKTLSYGSRA